MVRDSKPHVARQRSSRRSVLKRMGAISGVSTVGALAGCSGQGGGDGGGGDGGDGGDGGGGGDTSSNSDDLTEVTIVMPPWYHNIVNDWMQENGVWEKHFSERGYTANIEQTWSGGPLFASGKADISFTGTVESARIAAGGDLGDITVFGPALYPEIQWPVRAGSKYAPSETGSVQASFDLLAENDDSVLGIYGWASGTLLLGRIAINEAFGYELAQEGGDFENVVSGGPFAQASLVAQGDTDWTHTGPSYGAAPYYVDDEFEILFSNNMIWPDELGAMAALNSLTTKTNFADEEPDALNATIDAWNEGISWMYDMAQNDMSGLVSRERELGSFSALEEESAVELSFDWVFNLNGYLDYRTFTAGEDLYYEGDNIQAEKDALQMIQDSGFLESGWRDNLHFRTVEPSDTSLPYEEGHSPIDAI